MSIEMVGRRLNLRMVLEELGIPAATVDLVKLADIVHEVWTEAYAPYRKGLMQVISVEAAPTNAVFDAEVRKMVAHCIPEGLVEGYAQTLMDRVATAPRFRTPLTRETVMHEVESRIRLIRQKQGTATLDDGLKALNQLTAELTTLKDV